MEIKKNNRKYYLSYSIIFIICSSFFIGYMLLNGKTNINSICDGKNQHFRTLLYYSNYLKNLFGNLFNGKGLNIKMFDFSIGEGSDILRTLHSDGIGDPITLFSILIPEKYMYIFYMFSTFLRVYLAGLFFSILCFYFNKHNYYAILAGSLIYAFCFYSIESITLHIYFITPLMYMPLLIMGVDKIINNKKPYQFIITVFIASISWLYFFYMEALGVAIYAIVKLFIVYKRDYLRILKTITKIMAFALLGLGLAGLVLIPMIIAYVGDNRMGIANTFSMFYPVFFYERLLTIFVSNDCPYDLLLGFAAPSLFAIALVFKNYKKNTLLVIINIICVIFVCFPICGKLMNGFSFVSQRWSFIVALPVAYSLVVSWEDIKKEKVFLLVVLIILILCSLYSSWSRTSERVLIPLLISIVFYFVANQRFVLINDKKLNLIMIMLLILNICYIIDYNFSERGANRIKELLSVDDAKNIYELSEANIMKEYLNNTNDEGIIRYTGSSLTNNSSMNSNVYSTNFYFSIANKSIQEFRKELGLQDRICWQIYGYDNRASLESLANVKYYITKSDYDGIVPYGFNNYVLFKNYKIYLNEYALPFGYTYKKSLSYDNWAKLNMLQKQELMLDYVFINDVVEDEGISINVNSSNYNIICNKGIKIVNNKIIVEKPDSEIIVKLEQPLLDENYFIMEGLEFNDIYNVVEDDHTESLLSIKADNGIENIFNYMTKNHHYYYGKSDYVGYYGNNTEISEFTIKFSLVGEYSYNKIDVCSINMNKYSDKLQLLSEEHLENIKIADNTITGDIKISDNKYLVLSIPYSDGWKAYIDGKETSIYEGNAHYLTVYLEKGEHEVEVIYRTPGIYAGLATSFISAIIIVMYILCKRKKTLNETNNII